MYDYIYTWKFNKKCRNVKVRLLHFWNRDSQGQMCYFFGLDVLGNSLSFISVFYHFYCYCCCCCCIYALLSTNYIGLPSYCFITFHYFPTSLLLFRAIDCLFFCLLFRFYRLFCTSHLLPLNIIDFYCFLGNIALSLSRANIAQFS